MQIAFSENINDDLRNWRSGLAASSYGVQWRDLLSSSVPATALRNEHELETYLRKTFYERGDIAKFQKWLTEHIDSRQIVSDLQYLLEVSFEIERGVGRITTFPRAPYSIESGFFYVVYRPNALTSSITTVYHELMHFLFHEHLWVRCEAAGLSGGEIHPFKESLTVLLNPILKQRNLPLDVGYPEHQVIRDQWVHLWHREQRFSRFFPIALREYVSRLRADVSERRDPDLRAAA